MCLNRATEYTTLDTLFPSSLMEKLAYRFEVFNSEQYACNFGLSYLIAVILAAPFSLTLFLPSSNVSRSLLQACTLRRKIIFHQ